MLKTDLRTRENIVIIEPDALITTPQIKELAAQVDAYINETDRVPNLVIHTKSIPFWASFDALSEHLKFVKNHHSLVRKVAIVSDSKLFWLAKTIVCHFVGATVRRFPEMALDDAIAWAQVESDHPGAILEISGLPHDVVGIDIKGLITSRDYSETLVPLVTAKAKEHDKLKLLCVIGDYFDGYSASAMWDDLRFGLTHLTTFSKLALVTDQGWIREGAKFFGTLMPTDVMVFELSELEEAKTWIKE